MLMTTVGAAARSETSKLPKLKTQIQEFTAQVAALSTQKSTKKPIQCFYCKQAGRIQQYYPKRVREQQSYNCGKLGHIAAMFWQSGNKTGMHLRGEYASQIRKCPTDIIVVANIKIQMALIMGSVSHLNLEIKLDSGASISLLVAQGR